MHFMKTPYTKHLIALILSCTAFACTQNNNKDGVTKDDDLTTQTDSQTFTTQYLDNNSNKETSAMPNTVNVLMKTNQGNISLELDAVKAPLSVANFVTYANAGHYDGTLFHRVIPGFMIQGGGFEPGMNQKPTNTPIDNEAQNGLSNQTYTIAMARTNAPHSATSQFFINVVDNSRLDFTSENGGWGYAVFGKVVDGQDVVKTIEGVTTGQVGPFGDVPIEDVIIESVTISE